MVRVLVTVEPILRRRGRERGHEEARRPRRGEIRAAGPNGILLSAPEGDDGLLSPPKGLSRPRARRTLENNFYEVG